MKNRKFVKLSVDMYSDTKFKIIDTMEDRDLINYVWTRLITLCGKVNLDGDLYMSKTIPYTTETLSIELNRSVEKVKLALKVFMDLEMIKVSEDNVYKVSNFAKHQNIKVNKGGDKEVNNEVCEEKKSKKGCEEESNRIIARSLSDNVISSVEDDIKVAEFDDKEVNINKDKVINIENKCSDSIRSEDKNLLNIDKKRKGRKPWKKDNDEYTLVSIDDGKEDDICGWSDGDTVEGDAVKTFIF